MSRVACPSIGFLFLMSVSVFAGAQDCGAISGKDAFTGSWPILVTGSTNRDLHVMLDIKQADGNYSGTWTVEDSILIWTLNGKVMNGKLVLDSVGPPKVAGGVQVMGVDGINLEFNVQDGILKGNQFFRNGGVRRDTPVPLESGSNLCGP